jgi:hypothetical protein
VAEFFIIGDRFLVITRQLQAAEVLSKLSTLKDKSSFIKVPLVITKQLKFYFNNYSTKSTLAGTQQFQDRSRLPPQSPEGRKES